MASSERILTQDASTGGAEEHPRRRAPGRGQQSRHDVDGVLVARALHRADTFERVANRLDLHARSMKSVRARMNNGVLRGYDDIADAVFRVLQAARANDPTVDTDATERLLASSKAFEEWCAQRADRARVYRRLAADLRKAALEYASGFFGDRAMNNRLEKYQVTG